MTEPPTFQRLGRGDDRLHYANPDSKHGMSYCGWLLTAAPRPATGECDTCRTHHAAVTEATPAIRQAIHTALGIPDNPTLERIAAAAAAAASLADRHYAALRTPHTKGHPMSATPEDEHRPNCAANAGEECECAYLDALDAALDDPTRRGPREWDEPDGIDA